MENIERSVRATGVRRLVVRLQSGEVTLSDSGGDHIEGVVESAREPRIDQHGSWLTIQSRQQAQVRLAIPAGIEVHVRTRSGDVTARVPLGNASIVAGSGDVRLTDATGTIEAFTGSGTLNIESLTGDGQLRTGSGTIAVGRVDGTLAVKSGSGDVTVASNEGRIFVKAGSGDVTVGVPEGCRTWLDLTSASGDIAVNLPEHQDNPTDEGEHARVQVTTASGDIRIARS